jgi:hypothetical protein
LKIAKYENILVTDADLSTPICEVFKLINQDCDIAIGSRKMPDSIIYNFQTPLRKTLGRIFPLMVNFLFKTNIKDTQCGFKLFHRSSIHPILFECSFQINRFAYDVELLVTAMKFGLCVKEIGVMWSNDTATKVRWKDIPEMFKSLLKIWIKHG